jgi:tRNA(fMet)-specific endonuclease VapC
MLHSMLDTNLCVRVLRDNPAYIRKRLVAEMDGLCISTVVRYELYFGAELSNRVDYQRNLVDDFCARLEVIDFDDSAASHSANIRADLKRRGLMIGSSDLLIAGHARSLGLKLITGNLGEFTRVNGLRCEDWLAG